MLRSKCRYLNREERCDVEVNEKEITLKDTEGHVIVTIKLNEILSIEQKGNEFIITMKNGNRVSIMITRELLKRIMFVTTLLELRGSTGEVLKTLSTCLLTLSRAISMIEEILAELRRGNIPNWDKVVEINAKLRNVILNELLSQTAGVRIGEVIDVLEELSRNTRMKYVNGIRMTSRKLVGIMSNECMTKLSRTLASVNFAVAVDVVLYIHSYCFARKFNMRLEADTSKARVVEALSELLNNVFWLGGEGPKRVMTAVLDSLNSDDADRSVEVFVNELIRGICSHYSITCPGGLASTSVEE